MRIDQGKKGGLLDRVASVARMTDNLQYILEDDDYVHEDLHCREYEVLGSDLVLAAAHQQLNVECEELHT